MMRALFATTAACLAFLTVHAEVLPRRGPGHGSGGGGGPAPTLYNDPTKNIFDTYDPLCDGTNPEIIFCDGFEDGTWHTFEAPGPNVQASAADDYWGHGAQLDTHLPDDQLDTDWTDCRTGAIDTTRADFGAAGTKCAASLGWVQNQNAGGGSNLVADGHHRTVINGTNPAQSPATGPYDINVRWYFREDGTKSIRCPAGWPNCPAWSYATSTANNNGYKAVEVATSFLSGGISGPVHGVRTKSLTATGALNLFDFGEFAGCSGSPPQDVQELQTWPAGGSPPHFDHTQNRGKWIAVQVRWRMTSDGRLTLWMDDCGEDGKQCSGTPTVRIDTGAEGSIDLTPQCLPNGIRELWFNYYNGGITAGEIKIDGIVVRDNTSLDLATRSAPIAFEPNHSGL